MSAWSPTLGYLSGSIRKPVSQHHSNSTDRTLRFTHSIQHLKKLTMDADKRSIPYETLMWEPSWFMLPTLMNEIFGMWAKPSRRKFPHSDKLTYRDLARLCLLASC